MPNGSHYKFFARFIAIVHGIIAVFVIIGNWLLAILYPPYRFPALFVVPLVALTWTFTDNNCGLTSIEQWLRKKYHPDHTYSGSYIYHYVGKHLGIRMTETQVWILAAICEGVLFWLFSRNIR